jgi:hypothetical protein
LIDCHPRPTRKGSPGMRLHNGPQLGKVRTFLAMKWPNGLRLRPFPGRVSFHLWARYPPFSRQPGLIRNLLL